MTKKVHRGIPCSVPPHIVALNPALWQVPQYPVDWTGLNRRNITVVSGSAFIDPANPYGPMGNPFSVVIGDPVAGLELDERKRLAQVITGTNETVFINSCQSDGDRRYELLLTVLTPTGKELSTVAHGFIGAIQTARSHGFLEPGSEVVICTTLDTTVKAFLSDAGAIALEFESQEPRSLTVSSETINSIFKSGILTRTEDLSVLSIGSPKLTIEVTLEVFQTVQSNLSRLEYDRLLTFQNDNNINGIHLFCRNSQSHLPEKAIHVNAYLGSSNVVDPATGVSNAGQISVDPYVKEDQEVQITQFTEQGPSAILHVKKRSCGIIRVNGTAVLFNYQGV